MKARTYWRVPVIARSKICERRVIKVKASDSNGECRSQILQRTKSASKTRPPMGHSAYCKKSHFSWFIDPCCRRRCCIGWANLLWHFRRSLVEKNVHNILRDNKNEVRLREKFWKYFAVGAHPARENRRAGAPSMCLDIVEISIDLKQLLFFRNLAQSKNPCSNSGVSRWENMFEKRMVYIYTIRAFPGKHVEKGWAWKG